MNYNNKMIVSKTISMLKQDGYGRVLSGEAGAIYRFSKGDYEASLINIQSSHDLLCGVPSASLSIWYQKEKVFVLEFSDLNEIDEGILAAEWIDGYMALT